jgi:hypothetical protein
MAAAERTSQHTVIWEPQPGPQTALITCPVFEVFFGGARGGGKTDGMLGEWASHASQYGAKASGLMVRRKRTELSDTIKRSRRIFGLLGAKFKEQDKEWIFPDGAILKFAYLENDSDAETYQGHSYTRVYVEEIGNFPKEDPVLKLMATLRSADGVPVGFRATGNPGGPGHMWVKARYVDNAPAGWVVTRHEFENPFNNQKVMRDRIYIPSRLSDNPLLMQNDPGYVANLQMQGSPELVKAWLQGDWNIIAGTAFEKLSRHTHMIRPFTIPKYWTKFTTMDWGTAKPYAIYWMAVCDDDVEMKATNEWPAKLLSKGSIIIYRELYGYGDKPDVGTREESWEVARKMIEAEQEVVDYRIADSAMWSEHDGPSAAENFQNELVRLQKQAIKKGYKVEPGEKMSPCSMEKSRKDRTANYLEFRNRISAKEGHQPGIYIFSTCKHFWRTVPELQLDEKHPEKGWNTEQEDHPADAIAYGIVSRPKLWTMKERDLLAYDRARKQSFEAEGGNKQGRYS